MEWNNIKVKQYGTNIAVNIDGVDVRGITHFEYSNNENELPMIYMEFICVDNLELDIYKDGE